MAGKEFSSTSRLSLSGQQASSGFLPDLSSYSPQRAASSSHRIEIRNLLNKDSRSSSATKTSSRPMRVQKLTCEDSNCGKSFVTLESLDLHRKRKHACPTSIVCDTCGCSFSSPANLDKHVRSVHEKVKPYVCSLCSTSFSYKDGLEQHINAVHKELRPYFCDQCCTSFKSKSNLHKHIMRQHSA